MVKYAQLDEDNNVVNVIALPDAGLSTWQGTTVRPVLITIEKLDADGNVVTTEQVPDGTQGPRDRKIATEPVQPGDVWEGLGYSRPEPVPSPQEQARARKRAAYANLKGATTIADIRTAMLELFAELDESEPA